MTSTLARSPPVTAAILVTHPDSRYTRAGGPPRAARVSGEAVHPRADGESRRVGAGSGRRGGARSLPPPSDLAEIIRLLVHVRDCGLSGRRDRQRKNRRARLPTVLPAANHADFPHSPLDL